MGIRQKLAAEFGSTPNKQGSLGRQHAADVTVTYLRTEKYYEELASSVFFVVSCQEDGWSGRMEDSMLQGCIPVIIQVIHHHFPCVAYQERDHRVMSYSNLSALLAYIVGWNFSAI
jgi:hypothetical protein